MIPDASTNVCSLIGWPLAGLGSFFRRVANRAFVLPAHPFAVFPARFANLPIHRRVPRGHCQEPIVSAGNTSPKADHK